MTDSVKKRFEEFTKNFFNLPFETKTEILKFIAEEKQASYKQGFIDAVSEVMEEAHMNCHGDEDWHVGRDYMEFMQRVKKS